MIIFKRKRFVSYIIFVIASINRRRSTTETKQTTLVYDNDHDHEKSMKIFHKFDFKHFDRFYLDVLLKKMNYVNLIDDN
jgi:hypothetical protein